MNNIPKYVYKGRHELILSESRPGGAQWDHVTSYAIFKEKLRKLDTTDLVGTIGELVLMIGTMKNNYNKFLMKQYDNSMPSTAASSSSAANDESRKSSRIPLQEALELCKQLKTILKN